MTRYGAAAVAALFFGAVASAQQPVTLQEAVRYALASDQTLAQARESVAAAEADVMAAKGRRLPTVDLTGEYATNPQKPVMFLPPAFAAGFGGATSVEIGGDYELAGAVTARLSLWTAGRVSAAIGAARAGVDVARFEADVTRDYVVHAASAAYLDVLLAQAALANAEQAQAEAAEAARLAAIGLEQGTASRFDALRADVELANHRPRVVGARNDLDVARLALARICNADVVPSDTLAAAAPAPAVGTLVTRMRAGSAELKALAAAVAAREQQVRLAAAGRGPVVQLSGNYAVQGQWDDDVLPGDDEAATSSRIALAVQVPIFDGLQARADLAGARAGLRQAQLAYEQVLSDRELAVRRAALTLESTLAALDGAEATVRLAEEAYRLAVVRQDSGVGTALERLDAQTALSTARAQLATALHASNLARSALVLAVGSSLDDGGGTP